MTFFYQLLPPQTGQLEKRWIPSSQSVEDCPGSTTEGGLHVTILRDGSFPAVEKSADPIKGTKQAPFRPDRGTCTLLLQPFTPSVLRNQKHPQPWSWDYKMQGQRSGVGVLRVHKG